MRLAVAEIVAPHGVRGEVRARPLTDFPERLASLREVWLAPRSEPGRSAEVISARPHARGNWLLRLGGVERRQQAEALRGAILEIDEREAVPLSPGAYYVHQLVGLPVVTADGRRVGQVRDVLRKPAHDVIVVRDGGREHLIPAVAEFVEISLPERRVTVRPIPGMIDEVET